MELVLFCGAVAALALFRGGGPPRYQRLRGAEQWADADEAQRRHLDHWFRCDESKEPEDSEDEQ